MKNFYFTFGSAHITKYGLPMQDYWVTVVADDYSNARHLFCELFSSKHMPAIDKWAFQYKEEDFDRSYFRKGEYCKITQGEKDISEDSLMNKDPELRKLADHYTDLFYEEVRKNIPPEDLEAAREASKLQYTKGWKR